MTLNKLEQNIDESKFSVLQSVLEKTVPPVTQRQGMQSTGGHTPAVVWHGPWCWALRQAFSETGYGNEDGDGGGL